jgi:hypothetical protein
MSIASTFQGSTLSINNLVVTSTIQASTLTASTLSIASTILGSTISIENLNITTIPMNILTPAANISTIAGSPYLIITINNIAYKILMALA